MLLYLYTQHECCFTYYTQHECCFTYIRNMNVALLIIRNMNVAVRKAKIRICKTKGNIL